MSELINNKKANFGTMPVFVTAISTILGAVLFLRFGYAIGHTGLIGIFGIIILGHLITIPTALAVAEIATNQKVEGGGAYYIISRSFGLTHPRWLPTDSKRIHAKTPWHGRCHGQNIDTHWT